MSQIQGIVDNILFKNEDNGYVVANIIRNSEKITIVGCMPFIREGQDLKIEGEWVLHPQFGQQFKAEICEEILPTSILGIEKYLSSGIIAGIGPVTAKKIVSKFGEETLEVLDKNIERLKEIEGIGEKKINTIAKSYNKHSEIKNLMMFLQPYGITTNQCIKIHKKYSINAIERIKENPYALTEDIAGIGFKIADKLAQYLGIDKNSPFRIQSGVNYIINEFCRMGNTYMPLKHLIDKSCDILKVSKEEIEKNIYQSTLDGKLKVETINENECVFTIPYYYCELGVTKKIITLACLDYKEIDINVEEEIQNFEKENNIEFDTSQREAIIGAFKSGIEVITGGPGTGKTTIINCITYIFEKASMTVFMAAPTGRAAKRMTEATNHEAKTIHRLLELGFSDTNEFLKDEESPLECDVLILDEASMIDIMLMQNLLKAVGMGTRVIIVGDVDQLPSVGPGNVLRDVIESGCVKVVRLKEIFRQAKESMIIVNAHKINEGKMPVLNKRGKDFYFLNCDDREKIADTILELINKRLPKFNKKWNRMEHIQILSPMRKGTLGVCNLNNKLQTVLNEAKDYKKEREFRELTFRVGDKVMQIKNNYNIKWTREVGNEKEEGVGVFNGDVGFIEDIDEENDTITVIFDDERKVIYENIYFDEIDLAYAITIHKSQGSEFPVVIMPVFMGPQLLMNRNLFYTGITRAKQMVVLVGSLKSIHFMISNDRSFERYSALKWRICDILKDNIFNT